MVTLWTAFLKDVANCDPFYEGEVNVHSQSLKSYRTKFNPIRSFRVSMKNYYEQDWLGWIANLPLAGVQEAEQRAFLAMGVGRSDAAWPESAPYHRGGRFGSLGCGE